MAAATTPKIRYSVKQVRNLTVDEYRRCYRLTMGSRGQMASELSYMRRYASDERVVLARDAHSREILAWALISQNGTTQVYVPLKLRKQGIGTRLVRKAVAVCDGEKQVQVTPWSKASRALFHKFRFQVGVVYGYEDLLTEEEMMQLPVH